MRSVILYTLARAAIFAVTAGVLALFGARGFLLLLLALLISGVVSYVLLSAQRDRMSAVVTRGVRSQREKFEKSVAKEDAPRGRAE
ncbi:DUF4229 domain-containing protein [Actinomadura sp. NPDC048955]|uniref:DUF4229 domain-containing protein n=1 Tax=Actinomadura luteofluorescens TaxID=46163 RepID=A0A7Y9EJV1_9ACTN|nr:MULTISPECIES: DUF4229 domain-containing protein [Actinomadura]MCR3744628.1 Protein of unknown function (DUF4229) [Actinomadura glauciflava]NYD49004.1 hypothetical protein [Actinomadura luteofluorescens]